MKSDKKVENIEDKELLRLAKLMKEEDYVSNDRETEKTINLGHEHKALFYKRKKQEVTFRVLHHQEYFISGKITKVIKSKTGNNEFVIELKLNNNSLACFCSWEIDFESMIPSKYNPIRYFIREKISEEIRQKVFERDDNICKLNLDGCKSLANEIDHIIPVSKGGSNDLNNLQASCSHCNKLKYNNLII